MMGEISEGLAAWSYGIAALAFLAFSIQLGLGWRGGLRGSIVLAAVGLSVLWLGFGFGFALTGSRGWWIAANIADALRSSAWFALLLSMLYVPKIQEDSLGGQLAALRGSRASLMVGVIAAACLVAQIEYGFGLSGSGAGSAVLRYLSFGASLILAIVGLVLVEQLFRNIPSHARWGVQPICLGLGCAFAFDLYLFADAFLFRQLDMDVWSARGIGNAFIIPLIAVSAARNREWTLNIAVSRRVVFHSTTLLAAGLYLLAIAGAGYYVRYFGGSWGRALQSVFLFAAFLALGLVVFSGSLRSKLRVYLNKHFFSYRFDYREEWLKFTLALSAQDPHLDIRQLSIKALADLVESPGGALWLRDGGGTLAPSARWNMPATAQSEPEDGPFAKFLATSGWVVNISEYKATPQRYQGLDLPPWLAEAPNAWLVVPLVTLEGLLGFVVLATPRTRLDVNWEVLDLLKTAGRQAASFLGQMQTAEALLESRKFDAFNRMSAFVVHDIKNLVAQLSLLLKNAERHRDNPEFQADMFATIDHAVERMKRLLMQLRAGTEPFDKPGAVDLETVVRRIERATAAQKPALEVEAEPEVIALCHAERIERVLGHLVQNAREATTEDGKVWIRLKRENGHASLEVGDNGHGMSPDFVRERLFKPFQTTKQAGMGIGAYESHQYITELGGKILVDSQPNVGTRVKLLLPLHGSTMKAGREESEAA